jgi:hypothetical protein
MAAFHVFVEGPTDRSPTGVSRLAEAIGNHYGIPSADLHARLLKGRVRVKANADRETADLYVRDLERLGAICTLEEANAENSQRTTPLPFPAQRPATPPAGLPTARPATPPAGLPTARPMTPSAPPSALASAPPSRPSNQALGQYQSGLAAAFSTESPAASLGALEGEGIPLSLSSVDGNDSSGAVDAGAFEPPAAGGLPASIGPAPEKLKPPAKGASAMGASVMGAPATGAAAKAGKPEDKPLDLFAPPDAEDAKLSVDIASDEKDISARKRASTPPPSEVVPPPTTGPLRKSQPVMQTPSQGVALAAPSSSKLGPLGDEKVRFVAGVLLAIILGFVPAHFIAGMREESEYAEIDRKVIRAQQAAETPEAYALLDKVRADQLARKEAEQRNAAIIAIVIWGAVASGIAFAWFRKIPWDSFE